MTIGASINWTRKAGALALSATLAAASLAAGHVPLAAQEQPHDDQAGAATGDQGAAPSGGDNPWVKLCNTDNVTKKEVCVVSQELRNGQTGQLLVSTSVRLIEGEDNILIVSVPIGVLLQPGVGVTIDKGKTEKAVFTVCFPNACVARMPIKEEYIDSMKRGGEMMVAVYDTNQKGIGFPVTLKGFTAAYDGGPTDPEVYAQSQRDLAAEIQRRAQEAAQKQQAGQQGTAAPQPQQ